METPRDPVTRTVFSADDLQRQQAHWLSATGKLVARLPRGDLTAICRQVYEFLDRESRGEGGNSPDVPLCEHAPDSYVPDHLLLTSAIAYCLAHDAGLRGKDLLLMRLAALAHEVPTSGWDMLLTRSTGLSGDELAWLRRVGRKLREQGEALTADRGLDSWREVEPWEDDPRSRYLWQAHLAASGRLHNYIVEDPDGEPIPSLRTRADFEHHPLCRHGEQVALVFGGATKIKGYVFESAKLPEVRGASTLLDRINRADVPALFGRVPSEANGGYERYEQVRNRYGALLELPECMIFVGGGNFLALAPTGLSAALANAVECLYTEETLTAQSAAVLATFSLLELQYGIEPERYWQEEFVHDANDAELKPLLRSYYLEPGQVDLDKAAFVRRKGFGELVTSLVGSFDRRRGGNDNSDRAPRAIPHLAALPFAQKCSSCDRRAAIFIFSPAAGESHFLCEPCSRKAIVGHLMKKESQSGVVQFREARFPWQPGDLSSWVHRFDAHLGRSGVDRGYAPPDLEAIGDAGRPDGYIGVVYADVNNLGGRVARLRTLSEYRQFAQRVQITLETAVYEALQDALNTKPREEYPFEVLSVGGDDLLLIVPGQHALPVALKIAQQFEERLGLAVSPPILERAGWHRYSLDEKGKPQPRQLDYQPDLALSAGAVLAQDHTPIFLLHNLVHELVGLSKAKAKDARREGWHGGTVDFLSLKSTPMLASGVSSFRRGALQRRVGNSALCLTLRPYTLPEVRGLLRTAKQLKANVPRTQLAILWNMLLTQTREAVSINYLYFATRQKPETGQTLYQYLDQAWCTSPGGPIDAVPPWRRAGVSAYETVLRDVLELLDFVDEEAAS